MNYYRRKKWYSKLPIFIVIKRTWNNFWYKMEQPKHLSYGSEEQGWKTFRKQRLFNLIIITIIIVLFFYVL